MALGNSLMIPFSWSQDLVGLVTSFRLSMKPLEIFREKKLIMAKLNRLLLFRRLLNLTSSLHRAFLKHLVCQRLHRPYHRLHHTFRSQYFRYTVLDPKGLLVTTSIINAKIAASHIVVTLFALHQSHMKILAQLVVPTYLLSIYNCLYRRTTLAFLLRKPWAIGGLQCVETFFVRRFDAHA